MKKSIRGSINTRTQTDKDSIIADINKVILWKLDTNEITDDQTGETSLIFEAWIDNPIDEAKLWIDLKLHADKLKGKINRHECTHDEKHKKPCVITEEYTVI